MIESARKANVSVLDATFTIDQTKPCKHGRGTIFTCGQKRDGSMFPFCAIGDIGENRCSQVLVQLGLKPANEVLQK